MCHVASCSGWSYLDSNDTKCRVCSTTVGHWSSGVHAKHTIDEALFKSLGVDDPVRKTMQQFLDAGSAVLHSPPVVDSYAELHGKVRACTDALVRSENQLNNQRNNLRQCREKLAKLEFSVQEHEKEVADKRACCNATREQYEKLVGEQNLRSTWATAAESTPAPAGGPGSAGVDAQQRNAQLEAELRAMREAFQQLSEAHRAATTGGGVPAGSGPGFPPAPAAGAAGPGLAAAGGAPPAAAAAGLLAVEDDPDHKGVKRPCHGFPGGLAPNPGTRSAMETDPIEQFDGGSSAPAAAALTQGATPQQVIEAAKKAASSANLALGEQKG